MTQPDLLTAYVPVRDSHVLQPEEIARLRGQNGRVLARLVQGPMTRDEIYAIGRNVTARVSDVRSFVRPRGLDVKCIEHDHTTGATRYALVKWPQEQGE